MISLWLLADGLFLGLEVTRIFFGFGFAALRLFLFFLKSLLPRCRSHVQNLLAVDLYIVLFEVVLLVGVKKGLLSFLLLVLEEFFSSLIRLYLGFFYLRSLLVIHGFALYIRVRGGIVDLGF